MKIEILTLFPEIFSGFFSSSLIGKAIEGNLVEIKCSNFRDFAEPPHFCVDDSPYGGGAGMVLKPEPLAKAIRAAKLKLPNAKVVLLSASGNIFTQDQAREFSSQAELILVCGRYEGVDQRLIESLIDYEISVGDYVVMGGEVPAMLIIEAITRLIPGVLGNSESVLFESFASGNLLEAPQYTRPPEFEGRTVPDVLLSGNHQAIVKWREDMAQSLTKLRRPDLIKK